MVGYPAVIGKSVVKPGFPMTDDEGERLEAMTILHLHHTGEVAMQFEEREDGGVMVIKPLDNRLDSAEASDFKDKLHNLIDDGKKKLILDMERVEFVDSSGLGAIIACRKKMGTEGELVIASASEAVVGLFQLTRMDRVFRLFATTDEATTALG